MLITKQAKDSQNRTQQSQLHTHQGDTSWTNATNVFWKHLIFHLIFPLHTSAFSLLYFHPRSPSHIHSLAFRGSTACIALHSTTKLQHRHTHALTQGTRLLMLKVYFCYRCNNKRPFKSDLKIFRRNWLQHWGVEVLILASGSVQEKMDRFLWNALCVRI